MRQTGIYGCCFDCKIVDIYSTMSGKVVGVLIAILLHKLHPEVEDYAYPDVLI